MFLDWIEHKLWTLDTLLKGRVWPGPSSQGSGKINVKSLSLCRWKSPKCCSDTGFLEWLLFSRQDNVRWCLETKISWEEQNPALVGAACALSAADGASRLPLNCSQCITWFSISFPFLGASSALCFPFKLIEIKYLNKCHGHLEISPLFTLLCFHSVHPLQHWLLKPWVLSIEINVSCRQDTGQIH